MAYSGRQVASASATWAAAFRDILSDYMVANGFTLVETWTSTTKTCKVLKSAAASNGVIDFYVGIYTYNDTTLPQFVLAEDYDSVNHKFRRYVPNAGNVPNAATDATYGYVTDATGVLPDSTILYGNTLQIGSQAFAYWVSCNSKRIVLGYRYGSTDYALYCGLVDNMLNETDYPWSSAALLLSRPSHAHYGGSSIASSGPGVYGGMTRCYPGAAANVVNFVAMPNTSYGTCIPPISSQYPPTQIYGGKKLVGRAFLMDGREWGVYNADVIRALYPDDVVVVPNASTSVNGDTITLDGVTYVRIGGVAGGGTSNTFVDTTA